MMTDDRVNSIRKVANEKPQLVRVAAEMATRISGAEYSFRNGDGSWSLVIRNGGKTAHLDTNVWRHGGLHEELGLLYDMLSTLRFSFVTHDTKDISLLDCRLRVGAVLRVGEETIDLTFSVNGGKL